MNQNILNSLLKINIAGVPVLQILEDLRLAIIVFDFFLIIATIYLFRQALKFRPRFGADPNAAPVLTIRKDLLLEKWASIQAKVTEGKPDSLKVAVIQADSLIDSILKNSGLEGDHMADRLDNIEPGEFQSFEDVWASHKIRNQVVHGENFELTPALADKALKGYEKFLRELKVLT